MSAGPEGPIPGRTADERARDVIRAFIAQYRYLHEWRIQKLVFYADLLSLSRRGYRLTSAQFRRHHYGVYSEQIHTALHEMGDLQRTDDTTPTGRATVRYSIPGSISSHTLTKEDLAIIQEAHEATRTLTNEELADWGKETTLWRSTDQGDALNFDAYAKFLGRDSAASVNRYQRLQASTQGRKARFRNSADLRADLDSESGSKGHEARGR